MTFSPLLTLSPLDGRYQEKCTALQPIFSEYGLMRYRLQVEVAWLIHLSQANDIPEVKVFSAQTQQALHDVVKHFDLAAAEWIKNIENTTRHDVKAIEYYLKEKIAAIDELTPYHEFIHFACTSEDINNLSYALMLKEGLHQVTIPLLEKLIAQLRHMAHQFADAAMLSRTHGQPASPTTMGKELANVVARLTKQMKNLTSQEVLGKINGAVGNFNAHLAAYPHANWLKISQSFVESLGLTWNPYTTQIEPHDNLAECLQNMARINTILIDLCRDIWQYISLGYFSQRMVAGEVGSSTMPHKINPIDFENAEGNLGIANALGNFLAEKLPVSRGQRDLTDSTCLRNLGVFFGHGLLAYQAILAGLNKLEIRSDKMVAELNQTWEILTEAVQTVMRRYHVEQPYEKLKALSRGRVLDTKSLHEFIQQQNIPYEAKEALLKLSPQDYIGLAAELARKI